MSYSDWMSKLPAELHTTSLFKLVIPDFFICGLNPTLPHNSGILRYILRVCDSFPNVVRRGLPEMLRWAKQQHEKTPMNIIASDVVTRADFVKTVVELNLKKGKRR